MKNKGITLYSTSVPIILTAFMSWFTTYVQSPTTVDMNQFTELFVIVSVAFEDTREYEQS